jgi:hypothetical protein
LEELAKKFKEESLNAENNQGFGPDEERKEGSMANFFDKNI